MRKTFKDSSLPFIGLIANKCAAARAPPPPTGTREIPRAAGDLSHMRAVKSEVHNRFADENVLYSFMMSAKSGDQVGALPSVPVPPRGGGRPQVKSCFLRVAAVLSNTNFSRPEIEVESQTARTRRAFRCRSLGGRRPARRRSSRRRSSTTSSTTRT